MAQAGLEFSRIHTEIANQAKVATIFDFAFGEYIATKSFFDEISLVQQQLLSEGKVKLNTGQVADLESTGGMIAVQLYMETLESSRQAMVGLAKLGLNVEKQVWKLQ